MLVEAWSLEERRLVRARHFHRRPVVRDIKHFARHLSFDRVGARLVRLGVQLGGKLRAFLLERKL